MLNIAHWVTKAAASNPDDPALIEPDLHITRTFGELRTRTRLLAHAISELPRGGKGGRVAAFGRNSLELVELYIACAWSGSLLFPMNWRQSTALNQEALVASKPAVVFYDVEFAGEIDSLRGSAPDARWIEWAPGKPSGFEDLIREFSARPDLPPLPDPMSLINEPYLAVSTGGSTGIPKAAIHSQYTYGANLINFLAAQRVQEQDVFMMLGQLFHILGYMPFAFLAMGRPVVITNFDAERTIEIINAEGVTVFFAIATMLPRMVEVLRKKGITTPTIRCVGYGGARTAEEVIRAAATHFDADMMQIWGMTEFGTGTILGPEAHRLALSGDRPDLLRSCGRAGFLSDVKVVDQSGELVPQDGTTVGELCYHGPNNMLRYFNRPEETADIIQGEWVHTGDGATWDREGYFYIADRIKSMIISGGENIFPAEIEHSIANIPGITEVSVVAAPHPEWGEIVRAVVVCPDRSVTEEVIVATVERELGTYRKPRIVTFVDALPMTPTGKINLKAVREIPLGDSRRN